MGLYLKSKFISTNCMDHINLHDCSVRFFTTGGAHLLMEFDYIYILDSHPLNPGGISKYTGVAALLFKDYSVDSSAYFDRTGHEEERFVTATINKPIDFFTLLDRFLILKVKEHETQGDALRYQFYGERWGFSFAEFYIKCKSMDVGWDEFEGDAWFDAPHKPGDAATLPDGSAVWILGKD